MGKKTIKQMEHELHEVSPSLIPKINLNYIVFSSKKLIGYLITASSGKGRIIKRFKNVDLRQYLVDDEEADPALDLDFYDINDLQEGENEELYDKIQKLSTEDKALIIDIMC